MVEFDQLTPRQRECLRAVANHRTYKEIARDLGISDSAVEKHLRAAREKLNVDSTAAAARLFLLQYDEGDPHGGSAHLSVRGDSQNEGLRPKAVDRNSDDLVFGTHHYGSSDHDDQLSPLQTLSMIGRVVLGTIAGLTLLIASAEGLKSVLT